MLIKLTNQVIDISLDNIEEIQKKSIWWDTGWTDNYILIKYKTGFEHKIKCNSKQEVESDYNTIVYLLDTKGDKTNMSLSNFSIQELLDEIKVRFDRVEERLNDL